MTAQQLRDHLVELLADELGEYRIDGELQGPAVTLGQRPEPGTQVTGLELVVPLTPQIIRIHEFGTEATFVRLWRIVLKNWDDGASMEVAMTKVLTEFPQSTDPSIVGPTHDLIETATIHVEDIDLTEG